MSITITLTESEAARICYALSVEADRNNRGAWDQKNSGALNVASGRLQAIFEAARDEALAVVRRIEREMV